MNPDSDRPASSRAKPPATSAKRTSFLAGLERDPQVSSSKRQARAATLTSHLSNASIERELMHAKAVRSELEAKLREKEVAIERLERDRRWLADREKEESVARENAEREGEEEKRKAAEEIRALRLTVSGLREQVVDLEEEKSSLSLLTANSISSHESQLATLTRQVSALTSALHESQHLADSQAESILSLRSQNEELSSRQGRALAVGEENEGESWSVVRHELYRQSAYLHQLELTNANQTTELQELRERRAKVGVLEEEKRSLEIKLSMLEGFKDKCIRAEAELEAGRKERKEWAKTAESQAPSITHTQALTSLRLTHASLLEEHGSTLALLRQEQSQRASVQAASDEQIAEIERLRNEVSRQRQDVSTQKRKWEGAERECGFLRALLASYAAESALDAGGDKSSPLPILVDDRVQHLESLLAEQKQIVQDLEKQLASFSAGGWNGGGKTWAELREEAARLTAQNLDLEQALTAAQDASTEQAAEIETLSQQLFDLGGEIAGGRHIPPGTRILSLRDNPAQRWADTRQEILDRLKGENEALLKRLAELAPAANVHRNESGQDGIVPHESWILVNKEKEELEELLKQKEKRLLRLQQVFASKSAEFRNAVESVLGLKLAFYPNGQVRVTSVFDLCASFVFQPTSKDGQGGMKMQLVAQGEGGPVDLPQMMRYWIEEKQCIPGFLASVTLECWDKVKREG